MVSNFELVAEITPSFCQSVRLFKWKSKRTHLQVVLIKKQSPSVQGYFTVASEANDDSGCPHTLEHIVFMGSEKYPYKGLLDKLSATQMSSTNAWTAQDQTCYTLSTAGYEGFLQLLPVYLDHILHATVKDSACVTEVYHIDGKGEEKGVVFSEMQGYEHQSDSLMTIAAQKMLYRDGSGYSTNTGGCLDALRTLQPDTIRSYHEKVYRPANLSVIVAGDVEPQELINVLEKFDDELLPLEEQRVDGRPFLSGEHAVSPPHLPLEKTTFRTIEFPDSSESSGELLISWLGPHISDLISNTAIEIVITYLCMQDSGKLEHQFIHVPSSKALASEISGYSNEYLHNQINIALYGVPILRLEEAATQVVNYLEKTLLDTLDFSFLKQCVDTVYDGFVSAAEENSSTFVNLAISEFIYGEKNTFESWVGEANEFEIIRQWSEKEWRSFIEKFIVFPHKACVLGRPSRDEYIKLDEQKKARLEEIKLTRDLNHEGSKLEKAISENEQLIPEHLIDMFPIPDFSKIRFISSKSGATPKLVSHGLPGAPLVLDDSIQSYLTAGQEQCGLALNLESIPSQFVTIKLYVSTQSVDKRLLPLIPVILGNLFASPMKLDDGRELNAEEVAQESQRDLLQASISIDHQLRELVSMTVKAKVINYARAVEWLKRSMFNVIYDVEHTSIFIERHLKIIPEVKRSDYALLNSSMDEVLLTEDSLRRQSDTLISESAVHEFERNLDKTVNDLKLLSSQLFQIRNIRGLVIGDIPQIAKLNGNNILGPWIDLEHRLAIASSAAAGQSGEMAEIVSPNRFLSPKGLNPGKEALVTLCAASDSTNVNVISKGILKYGDPILPILTVANTFLDMTEGPFWKAVRGPGFAYGASLATSVQMGSIILSIYSAADAMSALKACRDVVLDIVEERIIITEAMLSSVVATIVGDLASHLAETATAIEEKFADTIIKGYAPNYVYRIISEIRAVTPSQVLNALKQYILPLFDANTSSIFAVAPPSEEQTLRAELEKAGYQVTLREVDNIDVSDEDMDSDEDAEEISDRSSSSDDSE